MRQAVRPLTSFMPHSRRAASCKPLRGVLAILILALFLNAASAQDTSPGPTPPAAMQQAPPPAVMASASIRDVLFAALRFLGPRTLEAHSAREFCIWGLDGLTAIDPTLSVTETAASPPAEHANDGNAPQTARAPEMLSVLQGQTVLFTRPLPASDDQVAWADLVTAAMKAAWDHSATLRDAGPDALLQGFFDELFNHLDPYSRYLGPSPAVSDRTRRAGDVGTVGLILAQNGRSITIAAVNANGPAWDAGVDAGEHVLAVNGHSTRGQDAATVQDWLNGPDHSTVTLSLSGRGRHATSVKLERVQVPPETVFASTEGAFTVLRVTSFSTQTAEEISQYLDQAIDDPAPDSSEDLSNTARSKGVAPKTRGVIIDLRGDRGGVLQQAVTTAALLLDHGVAVTTRGRNPLANHVWSVQGGDMTNGAPVVILVDGRTASAAEILASALADHHRAVVVGSETLGKGLVQVIGQMPNGGELFVTWSRNQAPLGWPIQGLGVMPQVCTSLGAESLQAQLAALKSGTSLQTDALQAARSARYPVPVAKILDIRKHCPAAIGTDADMDTARALLTSPEAYRAALASVPDEGSVPFVH